MKRAPFLVLLLLSTACDSLPPLAFSEGAVNEALGDQDGDGFVACAPDMPLEERISAQCDCNDARPDVVPLLWYADADLDGYGDPENTLLSCDAPPGHESNASDCNDAEGLINPEGIEVCDARDNNCTGDESDALQTWYPDEDGDGAGALTGAEELEGCDHPGWSAASGDCDDSQADVSPNAPETCNERDDDCDGTADDNAVDAPSWCLDEDSDGFGSSTSVIRTCTAPSGSVSTCTDCDDNVSDVNPSKLEVCEDTVDNDCNGVVDDCPLQGDCAIEEVAAARFVGEGGDFSTRMAGNADSDRDGKLEIVISAPEYSGDTSHTSVGRVYVYEAPLSGDVTTAQAFTKVEGDEETNAGYGISVGDVDGDGRSELLVGAPATLYEGGAKPSVMLFRGPLTESLLNSGNADVYIQQDAGNDFGIGVQILDNVDGEGTGNIAAGRPYANSGSSDVAELYAVDSRNPKATVTFKVAPVSRAGCGFAWFDVSGDGSSDLLVVAGGDDTEGQNLGAIYVLQPPFTQANYSPDDAISVVRGDSPNMLADCAVVNGGDLNHDGHPDLMVGSGLYDTANNNEGVVRVLLGPLPASASLADAELTFLGEAKDDHAGTSVAPAGDFNGDGFDDVLVGAPFNDQAGDKAGAAYLLYGPFLYWPSDDSTLSLSRAKLILRGNAVGDNLGSTVAGVGDVNGDGYDDILVGAPYLGKSAGTETGGAYLVLGGPRERDCQKGSE